MNNHRSAPLALLACLACLIITLSGPARARQVPATTVFSAATPTVASAASTVIVTASSTRNYVEIQNNTGANIALSLSGATLTGITASSGNACIVLTPGQEWHSPPGFTPNNAITCYQTSGSSTNAITVVTG